MKVFDRLRKTILKIHSDKWEFLCPKVEYLGHVISRILIRRLLSSNINKENPISTTQMDGRSFLGMICHDFAGVSKTTNA